MVSAAPLAHILSLGTRHREPRWQECGRRSQSLPLTMPDCIGSFFYLCSPLLGDALDDRKQGSLSWGAKKLSSKFPEFPGPLP